MRKLLITAGAICCFVSAKAQFTYDYLKAADDYYRKADYYSAAQYYEKYLSTNGVIRNGEFDPYVVKASGNTKDKKALSSKEQAIYNLAESYRQLNYYVKAEPFYEQAANFDDARFPLADFHYAATLRALGKFEEAEKAFRRFLEVYKTEDKYTEAANREILNLQFIQQQMKRKDLGQYTVIPADAFASEGANYAPVWAGGNTVYFTTTRPDNTSSKKEHLNKVYQATLEGGNFTNAAKVNVAQPAEVHQGGASVSADGNTMYLTRWTIGEGKKTASIYVSRKSGETWSDPAPMSAGVNAADANNKQPFVTADGKLYFASDRAGGQGGFDLYVADVNAAGDASNVTNLTALNTKFDEEAPSYHAESGTLVFATNGRVGMGGFDLFFTKMKDGSWSTPENFGHPVNSIKNDMYFLSRGGAKNILQDVLISTDRAAECCLQMFAVSKVKRPKLIAGSVVDCKTNNALAGAQVVVKDAANNTVFNGTTTTSGTYNFSMEDFASVKISGTLQGYTPNSTNATAPTDEAAEGTTLPVLCLNKTPEVGTVEVLDNVYFAFNKAVVLEESFDALNKLAQILKDNPTVSVEISGHTDSKGDDQYNQKLSEARAKSVVEYLVSQGIDKSRLVAVGYGEAKPVAQNTNPDGTDNPEGREKNRRTEFKVIKN
jgi:outer membrane protein OmpA-like peptidoglycan-associated protein/tetratricopeptide (TPR) repeat protein